MQDDNQTPTQPQTPTAPDVQTPQPPQIPHSPQQPTPPQSTEPQPPTPEVPTTPQPPVEPGKPKSNKILLFGVVLLLIAVIGATAYLFSQSQNKQTPQPTSYEECVNAQGSVIQESYPATCVTKDGERFVQPLSEEEQERLRPPTATPGPTADWNTFLSDYAYQIEYPSNLTYEKRVTGFFAFLEWNANPQDTMFTIDEREEATLAEKKNQLNKTLINPLIKDIVVDSLSGFTIEGTVGPGYGEGLYVKSAHIDTGERIISISCDTNELCQTELLDQILSTFQFNVSFIPSE